ncbi:hypothetical protein [Pectobacterium carotovorum]
MLVQSGVRVGSKRPYVGSVFEKIINENNRLYKLNQLNRLNQHTFAYIYVFFCWVFVVSFACTHSSEVIPPALSDLLGDWFTIPPGEVAPYPAFPE